MAEKTRLIVASYQKGLALPVALLLLGLISFVYLDTIDRPLHQIIPHIVTHGRFWLPAILLFWAVGPFAILIIVTMIRSVVLQGGAAVWIEESELIYLHRWVLRVKCKDVVQVSRGRTGNFNTGIVIEMRDGRRKYIPTGLLTDPTEVIISRIKNEFVGRAKDIA